MDIHDNPLPDAVTEIDARLRDLISRLPDEDQLEYWALMDRRREVTRRISEETIDQLRGSIRAEIDASDELKKARHAYFQLLIPPDKRTRLLTKKEAAKCLYRNAEGTIATKVNRLSDEIAGLNIAYIARNRSCGWYCVDDFPEEVRDEVKP